MPILNEYDEIKKLKENSDASVQEFEKKLDESASRFKEEHNKMTAQMG